MIVENINKKYDIAIVGTGPAGFSLASELAKISDLSIILVESGKIDRDPEINKLSNVDSEGELDKHHFKNHSVRALGGTSAVWGGCCTTLEERSFLNNEWPINYREIYKYYKAAAEILKLPKESYLKPTYDISENSNIIYRPYYLSKPVRFGSFYNYLKNSKKIDLILDHTCTEITPEGRSVQNINLAKNGTKTTKKINAKYYVIACGGIGNVKLLSNSPLNCGDFLGLYLSEHPHIYDQFKLILDIEKISGLLTKRNAFHAIQLKDDYCVKNNISTSTISFSTKKTQKAFILGKIKEVYKSDTIFRTEMPLYKNNLVLKSEKKDSLEQSKMDIKFKFNLDKHFYKSYDHLSKQLLNSSIGRLSLSKYKNKLNVLGGGHLMCTTRMGSSIKDSVVDKNCKIHNSSNLFIAGSSIFSATAAANPTMSIVAFAIRLAHHLKGIS